MEEKDRKGMLQLNVAGAAEVLSLFLSLYTYRFTITQIDLHLLFLYKVCFSLFKGIPANSLSVMIGININSFHYGAQLCCVTLYASV